MNLKSLATISIVLASVMGCSTYDVVSNNTSDNKMDSISDKENSILNNKPVYEKGEGSANDTIYTTSGIITGTHILKRENTIDPASTGESVKNIWFVGPNKDEACPSGYTKLDRDLNEGSPGDYIYMCVYDVVCGNGISEILYESSPNSSLLTKHSANATSWSNSSWTRNGIIGGNATYGNDYAYDLNKKNNGAYVTISHKQGSTPYKGIAILSSDNSYATGSKYGNTIWTVTSGDLNKDAGGRWIYVLTYKP
ncbi:MAG: hypothetical protein OCC49_13995 [Fibrobacterales bacterium]